MVLDALPRFQFVLPQPTPKQQIHIVLAHTHSWTAYEVRPGLLKIMFYARFGFEGPNHVTVADGAGRGHVPGDVHDRSGEELDVLADSCGSCVHLQVQEEEAPLRTGESRTSGNGLAHRSQGTRSESWLSVPQE